MRARRLAALSASALTTCVSLSPNQQTSFSLSGKLEQLGNPGSWFYAAGTHAFDGGAIDEEDVEAAVVIAVEEADAAAGGVDDVVGFGSGDMDGGKTDVLGDVLEGGNGREVTAIRLGSCGPGLRCWRDRHRHTLWPLRMRCQNHTG